MVELLDREDQDWLLEALAGLVRSRGADRFLSAPLLEPTSRFFPDEWEPSIRGVEVLARRVLLYAGLEHLHPYVRTFSQPDEIRELNEFGDAKSWGHEGATAWFAGLDGGRCLLDVAEERIGEPEVLLATMCHEVTHAWRAVHHLAVDDRDEEERLTDASTVYLGFGVLTTNGSFMYRTSGELVGAYAVTRCSLQRAGYLSPEAMAFLLAAQSLARGIGWWERRRLRGLLEPNQADFYRHSVAILRRRGDLPTRLLISPPASPTPVPQPVPLALAGQPLPEAHPRARANEGGHVYRVKRSKARPYAFWGAILGLAAGFVAQGTGLGGQALLAASALGTVLGGFVGRSQPWDYCSDPSCAAEIAPSALECPRCGGAVRGSIAHPDERLDRDERI